MTDHDMARSKRDFRSIRLLSRWSDTTITNSGADSKYTVLRRNVYLIPSQAPSMVCRIQKRSSGGNSDPTQMLTYSHNVEPVFDHQRSVNFQLLESFGTRKLSHQKTASRISGRGRSRSPLDGIVCLFIPKIYISAHLCQIKTADNLDA